MGENISMRQKLLDSSITIIIINDNKPHCFWKYRHFQQWCRCLRKKNGHIQLVAERNDSALISLASLLISYMDILKRSHSWLLEKGGKWGVCGPVILF
jgi:hypothetical protein